jgi:hypothetical protein
MKIILVIFITIMLSACSTPYQKRESGLKRLLKSYSGGYSEQMLSENVAVVTFKANGYTSKEKAHKFALRRSAELTLERNYDYFSVEGDAIDVSVSSNTSPVRCTSYDGYNVTCTGGGTRTFHKPEATINIRMFKGEAPERTGFHNARILLDYLTKED